MIEKFQAIAGNAKDGVGKRLIDGIIVLGQDTRIQTGGTYEFRNKDIIVVQAKAKRLGMYLMGQAFFSREIMKRYMPNSIMTVAICAKGDPEMEAICAMYGIEVEVKGETKTPLYNIS